MSTYEFDGDEFYNPQFFDNCSNPPKNGNDNESTTTADIQDTISDVWFSRLIE